MPDAPILTVTVHDEDETNKFHYKVRVLSVLQKIHSEDHFFACSLMRKWNSPVVIVRFRLYCISSKTKRQPPDVEPDLNERHKPILGISY